jgi:hypothetical protein
VIEARIDAPTSVLSPNQPRFTTENRTENSSEPSQPNVFLATTSPLSGTSRPISENRPAGMKPISHDTTIAAIRYVSPNLNSSNPISGVVAEADAISHTMNICHGFCVRWFCGTGATPTVSISPPTRRPRVGARSACSGWCLMCTTANSSPRPGFHPPASPCPW